MVISEGTEIQSREPRIFSRGIVYFRPDSEPYILRVKREKRFLNTNPE